MWPLAVRKLMIPLYYSVHLDKSDCSTGEVSNRRTCTAHNTIIPVNFSIKTSTKHNGFISLQRNMARGGGQLSTAPKFCPVINPRLPYLDKNNSADPWAMADIHPRSSSQCRGMTGHNVVRVNTDTGPNEEKVLMLMRASAGP